MADAISIISIVNVRLLVIEPAKVGEVVGRSYIIGSEGLIIPGYSDDQTLRDEGYDTDKKISNRRKEITANRVLVSLNPSEDILDFSYSVTYIVGVDSEAKDILPGSTEYVQIGTPTFTYDENQQ